VYPPAKKEKRGAWRAICVPPVRFAAVPLPEPELPTTPGAQRWVSLRPGPILRAVHTVVQRVVKAVKACLYPTSRTHDALVEGGQWNGFCSGLRLERQTTLGSFCVAGERPPGKITAVANLAPQRVCRLERVATTWRRTPLRGPVLAGRGCLHQRTCQPSDRCVLQHSHTKQRSATALHNGQSQAGTRGCLRCGGGKHSTLIWDRGGGCSKGFHALCDVDIRMSAVTDEMRGGGVERRSAGRGTRRHKQDTRSY